MSIHLLSDAQLPMVEDDGTVHKFIAIGGQNGDLERTLVKKLGQQ